MVAAFKDGRAAVAMVIRNLSGTLIVWALTMVTSQNPHMAEVAALHRASEIAEMNN